MDIIFREKEQGGRGSCEGLLSIQYKSSLSPNALKSILPSSIIKISYNKSSSTHQLVAGTGEILKSFQLRFVYTLTGRWPVSSSVSEASLHRRIVEELYFFHELTACSGIGPTSIRGTCTSISHNNR